MSAPAERDRTAVLTGAGSPWGAVLAEGLARHGWTTLLVDPAGEGLEVARERAVVAEGSVETLPWTGSDLSELLASSRHLPQDLGSPHLLVHALPEPATGPFAERSPASIVEEALRGYAQLVVFARRLLPSMIDEREGTIIVLGSAAARAPLARAAVHTATASALPRFLTSLDREVRRDGVQVVYLEPAGFGAPPLDPEMAMGEGAWGAEHRRYLVSDAAVARAFQHALKDPRLHHLRFRAHERTPPTPSQLQRYAERELHRRHPGRHRHRRRAPVLPASELQGRIAVVTGASRGIGRSIALHLAAHRMRLLLTGRDTAALARVEAEVRQAGGEPRSFPQDLLDPSAPGALERYTRETWGTPDLLVNNAGLGYFRRLARQDDEQLGVQLQVDLLAVLTVARAFLPGMLEQGRGQLLTVGSMAAEVPLPRLAPYSGIKGALKGFTLALDRELETHGLHVSVLEPVTVDTEFISAAAEPGRRDLRQSGALSLMVIKPDAVGVAAEGAVLRPRPVVMVPPRVRLLHALYRATLPFAGSAYRLPPSRGGREAPVDGGTPRSGSGGDPGAGSPPD